MAEEQGATSVVAPSMRYGTSFLEGAAEFAAEGRLDSTYAGFLGYDLDRLRGDLRTFIWDLKRLGERGRLRSKGYQDRVLWLVDRDEYAGQSSVRPELNTPYLITYGGHIGYSIRPSRRGQGLGKLILALTLDRAEAMGLPQVLVTCDADNLASKRIIEANGGQFESAMSMGDDVLRAEGRTPDGPVDKLRYWVDLTARPRRAAL